MNTRLHYPFKWKDRKVLWHEKVLFVPDRLEVYTFPEFLIESLFGNSNPLHVEYCSGNGAWVIAKALENPEINWIAVEKKFDRVSKIWSKMQKLQLKNLLIVCGEGLNTTQNYFPDQSIAQVFVNFPDPWPKKRHWKHRIIQQPFLIEMNRVLTKNGKVTFVTDDVDYREIMTTELQLSAKFTPLNADPYYVTTLPGYGSSFFEELWRAKGKEIYYHQWVSHA
jgi:tRNA (guanine-N7-)-methyltransferase